MTQDIVVREFALPTREALQTKIEAIRAFQAAVQRELIEGVDYGTIPGTPTPTLLKPGAEKIIKLFETPLTPEYEIEAVKDWNLPFFSFQVVCRLYIIGTNPRVYVDEGVGECNSMEAKYRWREAKRVCPKCGEEAIVKGREEYGGGWLCFGRKGGCGAKWADGAQAIEGQKTGRVPNDDIFSQVNTLLKMAKKRALVDAALSAGRLSNIFTQDIEDSGIVEGAFVEITPPATMEPDSPISPPDPALTSTSDPDMVCPIHGVRWFKSGKMRQFAHAVPGQPWCNMAEVKDQQAPMDEPQPPLDADGRDLPF